MRRRMKALVLTAGYGNGHIQVARSLEQAFRRNGIDQVSVLDLMREAHPVMDSIVKFLYERSLAASSYGFHYYGWSYYLTRDIETESVLARWMNDLGADTLRKVIERERPDAIVSTFPFGCTASRLRRYGMPIPTFTVVTDFALHSRWIHSAPDRFYVATDDLKDALVGQGVADHRVVVSGIPVRDMFRPAFAGGDADGAQTESSGRHILFMAGAYGIWREVRQIMHRLLSLSGVRVTAVCGRNEKLERHLKNVFKHVPGAEIYGYVERVDELMRRSDGIVTKAGGVTLSEAIQMNVPIFIFKPIPGQEKENARFLADKGAAQVSRTVGELADQIERLLFDGETARRMKHRLRELQTRHASDTIVHDIIHVVMERSHSDNSIA